MNEIEFLKLLDTEYIPEEGNAEDEMIAVIENNLRREWLDAILKDLKSLSSTNEHPKLSSALSGQLNDFPID